MRVVVDTVIFVRALINPYGIWGRIVFEFAGSYDLVLSEPISKEVLEVLHRPEIARKYRTVETRDFVRITQLLGSVNLVEPADISPVCRDPKDDIFLATAKAANADYLVSEDTDVIDLGEYEGTQVLTGREFLRVLEVMA